MNINRPRESIQSDVIGFNPSQSVKENHWLASTISLVILKFRVMLGSKEAENQLSAYRAESRIRAMEISNLPNPGTGFDKRREELLNMGLQITPAKGSLRTGEIIESLFEGIEWSRRSKNFVSDVPRLISGRKFTIPNSDECQSLLTLFQEVDIEKLKSLFNDYRKALAESQSNLLVARKGIHLDDKVKNAWNNLNSELDTIEAKNPGLIQKLFTKVSS